MGAGKFLRSKSSRRLSALSMVAEAGMALYRGNKRVAALLAGAAVLAYRWSVVGLLAELGIRLYQRRR
ncbi:hypothetical protein ACFQPA_07950 [Halomarina halobia]|uniref:Uncharacterized protein n=1 Tax=Halomarina halobia TaxID=3033386 RepID=A0ABD6ACK0_9EURY|nr:hypothetical protein [Halomarina sp. PSR21]